MTLADLIATKPGGRTLAEVRAWLEESIPVPNPERVTSTTCMARLEIADARALFGTLKAAATQDDLVAEALLQLRGEGLDLSHDNAKAMIDALFASNAALADRIKALGVKQIPRWQQVANLSRLKDGYILEALEAQ